MISPTPPGHDSDHLWVRRRLPAAAAGLLTDADEDRMQSHLVGCPECAEAWQEQKQALTGDDPTAGQDGQCHLAPAMIARWEQAQRTLQGLERETVRSHLERCAECRADLEALGHRPELAAAPVSISAARPRRTFGSGLAWGVGVTALAAVAAGLILMPGPPVQENAVLPWVAPVTLRGGSPAVLNLAPDAAGFSILAAIPTDLDPDRPATVTVWGPDGLKLLTSELLLQAETGRTLSIVIRDRRNVVSGDYRVVFNQDAPDGSTLERESTFQINIQPR